MAKSTGKKFESDVEDSCKVEDGIDCFRIKDSVHLKYVVGIGDYAIYKKPYKYYLELKSTFGKSVSLDRLPQNNQEDKQMELMKEKSKIDGVTVGFLFEFRGYDIHEVYFMSLEQYLTRLKEGGYNGSSISIDYLYDNCIMLAEEVVSNYWRNDEHELIQKYIDNGEQSEDYDRLSETLCERSKASIDSKVRKISKNGYKRHKRYIHYRYDMLLLFEDINNKIREE